MPDTALTPDEQKRLLENFVFSNDDLERLEALSAGFNIFDAIGMKHQEIRHSRTLSFLLGPQNGHGLSQYFLKRVLKTIALEPQNAVSVVDVDVANFADAETRCEWNSIDILIICPTAKLIVAIENKLLADEHSDQLTRYKRVLDDHPEWAGYRRLFAFLTVDGRSPAKAEDGAHWCNISYAMIADELGASHKALLGNMGIDQDVLIRHYVDLLRRSVLEDSEVAKLARKIYQAHKGALDIIFEHRPDLRLEIRDYLQKKIETQSNVDIGMCSSRILRFTHKDWRFQETIEAETLEFKPKYVNFEIEIDAKATRVRLELVVGDVPEAKRFQLRDSFQEALGSKKKRSSDTYPRGWEYRDLRRDMAADIDSNQLLIKIDNWWSSFVTDHLELVSSKVAEVLKTVR
ncbi:PDDEXK-like family protein [Devosia aquimaris]|uniref:PDDEXK-like family protein n=1 Tax=Devosia aquimaris TaxID=2866214 RepID=UPI001CD0D39C|nr:PD-(D/E)XK nuclease family protein [Devosia sp. CJK-A8-3]